MERITKGIWDRGSRGALGRLCAITWSTSTRGGAGPIGWEGVEWWWESLASDSSRTRSPYPPNLPTPEKLVWQPMPDLPKLKEPSREMGDVHWGVSRRRRRTSSFQRRRECGGKAASFSSSALDLCEMSPPAPHILESPVYCLIYNVW